MRALIIGDLSVIAGGRTECLPQPGENTILSEGYGAVSGVGANIAHDLAGLDVDVSLAGAVGRDAFGEAILRDLRVRSIDVRHIQQVDEPTSIFLIVLDRTGERTMIGYRGAMETFGLGPDLLEAVEPSWVHIAGYTMLNAGMPDAYRRLAGRARSRGIECSVELEGLAQAGRQIDLTGLTVFCNRHEYRMYFGREDVVWPEGSQCLVVKSGSEGCFLADRDGVRHVPSISAAVCDLTGAGDAFNAAFIAARLAGMEALAACRWGNVAGSLKVGVPGPRLDMTVEQLRAGAERAYHDGR